MEAAPPPVTPAVGSPPPASSSIWSRILNVFVEPGEVFREVRDSRPSLANYVVPALLMILLSWLGAYVIFSQESVRLQVRQITEQAIERQIEKAKMSEAQAEQTRAAGERFGAIGMKISVVAAPLFFALVNPLWWALYLWLVGTRALGGTFGFIKALEAAGLSNMIGVLDGVIKTLLIVVTGSLFASPSLAMLVMNDYNPESTLHGLLAMVNVMTFWTLAVRSVGLARLSGASFLKSAVWVFGFWLLVNGGLFAFGVAMRMLFAR